MAFTTPRTWTYGETVTEAQFNEQIRDNFNAVWVGTNAGDMDYYTSNATKARIGIGNVGDVLTVGSGTVPTWGGGGMSLLGGTVLAGTVTDGTISITDLSQAYTHLKIYVSFEVSGTASLPMSMQVNDDSTASNYFSNKVFLTTANEVSIIGTSTQADLIPSTIFSIPSNLPGVGEIIIFNYSSSVTNKMVRTTSAYSNGTANTGNWYENITTSIYKSDSPITSVKFHWPLYAGYSILPGASFKVYGLL